MVNVRRLVFALLALVLAMAIMGVVLASYYFPVVNPQFDSDISGWSVADCNYAVWTGDYYRSAPGALYSYNGYCWITQTVNLTQTRRYTLSGYDAWNGESEFVCRLDTVVVTVSVPGGGVWTACEVSADLAAGNYEIAFRVGGTDYGYFDDVSLEVTDLNPTYQNVIPLSSGKQIVLNYSYTFGEMSIVCALLLLDVLFAVRWVYDVALEIWRVR